MAKPTPQQIEAEIAALQACKTYVPQTTAFGDDNHRNLRLQIEELREGFDDTTDEWEDMSDSEKGAISDAKDWKDGYEKDSPSSVWDSFKPKPNK